MAAERHQQQKATMTRLAAFISHLTHSIREDKTLSADTLYTFFRIAMEGGGGASASAEAGKPKPFAFGGDCCCY